MSRHSLSKEMKKYRAPCGPVVASSKYEEWIVRVRALENELALYKYTIKKICSRIEKA